MLTVIVEADRVPLQRVRDPDAVKLRSIRFDQEKQVVDQV